ncbi:MAG: hypothetical protein E3J54_03015, partial [Actinobacteria bacterium]
MRKSILMEAKQPKYIPSKEKLGYRAELEQLIFEISTNIVNLPTKKTDKGINQALRKMGEFTGAD